MSLQLQSMKVKSSYSFFRLVTTSNIGTIVAKNVNASHIQILSTIQTMRLSFVCFGDGFVTLPYQNQAIYTIFDILDEI